MEPKDQNGRRKRQDYFEDYIYEKIPRGIGKGTRTVRVYAGDYHRQALLPAQRHWLRVLYVGLFFVSLGSMLLAAGRPIYANSSWFVGVAQVVALGCYAWMLMGFVIYVPTGQDFTKGEYRSGPVSLRRSSVGTAIALCAAALFTLVYYFTNLSRGYTGGEFVSTLLYLLAAAAVFAINRIENRVPYTQVPSERKQALLKSGALEDEDEDDEDE